jgi:uncharacterized repeat protein (TIGR01451 family)
MVKPLNCHHLEVDWTTHLAGRVDVTPPPNCDGFWYLDGTDVTLTAVPSPTFTFIQWVVFPPTGGEMNPVLTLTMDEDYYAGALFVESVPPPPGCWSLLYDMSPLSGGTVSISPPPNCGARWYVDNTPVTLTATPNTGYEFVQWGGSSGSTNPVLNIVMDTSYSLVAVFQTTADCHQIIKYVTPVVAGSVDVDPSTPPNCPGNLGWLAGSPVMLNVTENPDFEFDHWNAPGEIYDGSNANPLVIGAGELDHDVKLEAVFSSTLDFVDLYIQMNDSADPVIADQVYTYTLTVGNNGPEIAGNVVVTDELDAAMNLISVSISQGSCFPVGRDITCTVGLLPIGISQTIDIAVMPVNVKTLTNTARVFVNTPDEIDIYPDNNLATEATTIIDEPITNLTAVNNSPTALGEWTTFTATISSGTNVDFIWDFGDGKSASGRIVVYPYSYSGVYTASVRAINAAGMVTATTFVIIQRAITGLTAVNDGPTPLGMATTLTATVSDGTDINYIWDFGDGVTGIGPVVSHVYPAGGIYTAVVTATNMVSGQSAVTAVVIVAAEYKVYMPAVVGKPD